MMTTTSQFSICRQGVKPLLNPASLLMRKPFVHTAFAHVVFRVHKSLPLQTGKNRELAARGTAHKSVLAVFESSWPRRKNSFIVAKPSGSV